MNNDLITPKTMEISSFSNISLKLRYLSAAIRNKEESENMLVSIECYKEFDDTNKEKSIIRFSSVNDGWFEINPIKKYGGDILDRSISVRMYDLFNVIDNCKDEVLSFRIDDSTNELVINSFYNHQLDFDELEVRLPIIKQWDGCVDRTHPLGDPDAVVKLSNLTLFTAMKELNIDNKAQYIDFIFDNGKLKLQSVFNGVYSILDMKEMDVIDHGMVNNFSIPFNMFYLMSSTGQVADLAFEIYGKDVWVIAEGYEFKYTLERNPDSISYEIESTPVFIINTEDGFTNVDKINKINATENPTIIEYEKAQPGLADFKCSVKDRMTIYIRLVVATLSDDQVKFDGNIFYEIFSRSGVDAISVNKVNDDVIFIQYENAYMRKKVIYDHALFMEYREKSL